MMHIHLQPKWGFWVVPLLLAVAGCSHEATGTPAAGTGTGEAAVRNGAAITVAVVKPVQKKLHHKVEQPGDIQAFEQTPLVAKISGFVDKVYKDIGDEVKAGDLLVKLSVPEMDEELKQKEALAKQAQSEEERARKLADAAEAFVKVAEAKIKEAAAARQRAAAELTRAQSQYDRLKESKVVAAEVIEETKLGFEAARANLVEAEARVKSAEAGHLESQSKRDTAQSEIVVAEARWSVAKAVVRGQVELLKYAQLKAPFTGVVTRRHVDVGHFLQANPSGKGDAVMVVVSMDPVRIFVDVPENDAVLVSPGAKAVVRVQALKGEEFEGVVKRTAWALDPKNRTLRTEIDLPNPERRLRPGMYAFATIHMSVDDAWVLPAAAVATQGDKSTCFLAMDGKAQQVMVQLGLRDGTNIQVRRKRMSADGPWQTWSGDEQVIHPIPPGLADGQAVSTKAN